MVELSVIIVNYNVKYFLEQCLCSVKKAIQKTETEVFVVDNNSPDASMDYLKPKFPWVKFITNEKNEGFSKANNKALLFATGKHILFLNPDTIVPEDCITHCISFLDAHQDAGALGVMMIDGKGAFLKESKRGFPSPWAAFCKLSGLITLFPHTKLFSKYYLGNLSSGNNQIIDTVSGAFFFTKKEVLDKIGGFDEQFFMYAEDIDLSYRIQLAGYTNYYLAETRIIHFKGESTNKDDKYIKQFFWSMRLFSKKYFRARFFSVFYFFIVWGIWFRRLLAFLVYTANKKNKKAKNETKFFLSGDKNQIGVLEKKISSSGKRTTNNHCESTVVIFCEGPGFSFKDIISSIKNSNEKMIYKVHASESCSVVGSQDPCGNSFGLNSY